MTLKSIELFGFKSFGRKSSLSFSTPITCVVGPNGSGKSNIVESIRFVLGEQSMKSLRGKDMRVLPHDNLEISRRGDCEHELLVFQIQPFELETSGKS